MKYMCLLAAWLFVKPCIAQMLRSASPIGYTEVGVYSLHFTDVFSFTGNQASLSRVKNSAVGVYSERKYMLNELKRFTAAISFPFEKGGAGITADYTGFTGFNEWHSGVAYGRSLNEKIDLGMQFDYHRINMAGYGSAGTLNFELGAILHLTNKWHAGFEIYNPVGGTFGKNSGEKIASGYSFGIGYEASEKLFVSTEIRKEENQPVNVNVCMLYAFEKQFFVRGGIVSGPDSYFAGVGLNWNKYRVDMVAGWHPQAGLTPSLVVIFMLSKSKPDQE